MENRIDNNHTHSGVSTEGLVQIEDVSVSFAGKNGDVLALDKTNIDLLPGTFTALIGPSGCGKSTLLNALAGFIEPTTGCIRIDSELLTGPSVKVGVIFQQYALFPWFTALNNVTYALKRFKLSKAELHGRAMAALAEVGLAEQADMYPGQLSGGMKQRVAIARTFAFEPRVMLMDEPFGALDAQTRLVMHELLLSVWIKHQATVLFVTHDVDEALLLADRIHVMSWMPGRIIRSYDMTMPRPRSLNRSSSELLDVREEIIALLRPKTLDVELTS